MDKEIIRQLYVDLCEASVDRNLKKLDEILSDDYILIHMTGMKQSKDDYINSIKSGELKYYDLVHESIDITIYDNKAKVVGKTKTLASPFGMSKSWWRLRQDLNLEKINSKWIITNSVASVY